MNKPGIDGNFFFCFLLNLALNAFWLIPVVACFVLGAIFGWPGWIGWAALAAWAGIIFVITLILSWLTSTGSANQAPTGMPGKTTIRRSSQRPNSLEEYAEAHAKREHDHLE